MSNTTAWLMVESNIGLMVESAICTWIDLTEKYHSRHFSKISPKVVLKPERTRHSLSFFWNIVILIMRSN